MATKRAKSASESSYTYRNGHKVALDKDPVRFVVRTEPEARSPKPRRNSACRMPSACRRLRRASK
jgi:hypothetical protein